MGVAELLLLVEVAEASHSSPSAEVLRSYLVEVGVDLNPYLAVAAMRWLQPLVLAVYWPPCLRAEEVILL